ncbi:unnamed protein product [Moneuplotes crassus]|uniref:Uncharacterized protein n=1 Tax=Euplotes crassus TaxID=5936 RepID=A0AAD1UCQ5_EUPCR|nr:unnamed protein product [Moneuplotes crassus]
MFYLNFSFEAKTPARTIKLENTFSENKPQGVYEQVAKQIDDFKVAILNEIQEIIPPQPAEETKEEQLATVQAKGDVSRAQIGSSPELSKEDPNKTQNNGKNLKSKENSQLPSIELDKASEPTEDSIMKRRKGRPKLPPLIVNTNDLQISLGEILRDDILDTKSQPNFRSDSIRLKIMRRSTMIPYLILLETHRKNERKDLAGENIEKAYRRCFWEFIEICSKNSIIIYNIRDLGFVAFISFRFPFSKIRHFLQNDEEKEIYERVKKYKKKPSLQALMDLESPPVWEVMRGLLKIQKKLCENFLEDKPLEILRSLIMKLEFKLKASRRLIQNQ